MWSFDAYLLEWFCIQGPCGEELAVGFRWEAGNHDGPNDLCLPCQSCRLIEPRLWVEMSTQSSTEKLEFWDSVASMSKGKLAVPHHVSLGVIHVVSVLDHPGCLEDEAPRSQRERDGPLTSSLVIIPKPVIIAGELFFFHNKSSFCLEQRDVFLRDSVSWTMIDGLSYPFSSNRRRTQSGWGGAGVAWDDSFLHAGPFSCPRAEAGAA